MVEGLLINGTEVGRIIFLNFANKPGFNAKSKFAKKIVFFQNLIMLESLIYQRLESTY